MDNINFKVDRELLHGGNIQMYHTVSKHRHGSEIDFLATDQNDKTVYLTVKGKMAIIMNKNIDFFNKDILSNHFKDYMAKHTKIKCGNGDNPIDITVSRRLPLKLGSINIVGTWDYSSDKIVDWTQPELTISTEKRYTLFSSGNTNMTQNKGSLFARISSTNYKLDSENTLIISEFLLSRKSGLLKIHSLFKLLLNWIINRYIPKIVLRARKYRT